MPISNMIFMAGTLDFFFDFVSPYAYLAHTQLPSLAKRHGLKLTYHPIDLTSAKIAVGNTAPPNREIPIKHRYLRQDLRRWADLYAVALTPPAGYGSARVNHGAFLAIDQNVAQRYIEIVWRRIWGEGGDMNDDELLAEVAAEMGWPAEAFLTYCSSDAAITRLRSGNAHALQRGVFGVPTMMLGSDLWWGNDRLQFLEKYLDVQESRYERQSAG
jgi:2-hydroxychromene-2-carboxylate isomerase